VEYLLVAMLLVAANRGDRLATGGLASTTASAASVAVPCSTPTG
jgi:hypothetical protein